VNPYHIVVNLPGGSEFRVRFWATKPEMERLLELLVLVSWPVALNMRIEDAPTFADYAAAAPDPLGPAELAAKIEALGSRPDSFCTLDLRTPDGRPLSLAECRKMCGMTGPPPVWYEDVPGFEKPAPDALVPRELR
jgi:hypothetical protein